MRGVLLLASSGMPPQLGRMAASGGETEQHRALKRSAVRWALAHEFRVCGLEVRVPRSGFRADVAACKPATFTAPHETGESAIFECKQSRADFLRDAAVEQVTRDRLREVTGRRADLERMLGLHLPNLRRGETLFPECDGYDLGTIRHDGLRAVLREQSRLQSRLFRGTKFDRLRRYAPADRLYLVASPDVLEPHEVPAGWGLLLATGDELLVAKQPVRLAAVSAARLALVQAIALAGTRACLAKLEISWEEAEGERSRVVPQ